MNRAFRISARLFVFASILALLLATRTLEQAGKEFFASNLAASAGPSAANDNSGGEATAREQQFLSVPDPVEAEKDLRALTAEPHIAGSPADYRTAKYVEQKFREAGLETEIIPYRVWMNYPRQVQIEAVTSAGIVMKGPSPERVDNDSFQQRAGIMPPFHGYSPSGDVEGEVVYANYGRLEDFDALSQMGVDVRGKIVLVRYGENFRGVKVYIAQQRGALGVIIYSDPEDDGFARGKTYPDGPWRPASAVQRGTVEYGFQHPGDPTTPGFASLPNLPDSARQRPEDSPDLPRIPSLPLSSKDAEPILRNLGGDKAPHDWQGGLPLTYRTGPGPVRVHIRETQDYQFRTIWDVLGKVRGGQWPDEWVMAGNHRDAWVFGAVDPGSGTALMLEAARGIGALLKSGWQPRRTIIFASWDGEEQGLIGSTEWSEQFQAETGKIVAYFNTDTGAWGPNFEPSAVPSLKPFLRAITKIVPSPRGGTLYQQWTGHNGLRNVSSEADDPLVQNLGSGSDFTALLDHAGVPATDIRSSGDYGVYHSAFDDYDWFRKFGDPGFRYVQELARVFGLEVLRMADAEVLPHDYQVYGQEIRSYLEVARQSARHKLKNKSPSFQSALEAAFRFERAGRAANTRRVSQLSARDARRLNSALSQAERALLLPAGLPRRPYFRHAIYAPSEFGGYSATMIPGLSDSIQRGNPRQVADQLRQLTAALSRAAEVLESACAQIPAPNGAAKGAGAGR